MTAILTNKQKHILRKHMRNKNYRGKPVIKRVFVPQDKTGNPCLLVLCRCSDPDKLGRIEYCVFGDYLSKYNVPTDKAGFGTETQALAALKEQIFYELVGWWPWAIKLQAKEANKLFATAK
jgi:hypothetical protein